MSNFSSHTSLWLGFDAIVHIALIYIIWSYIITRSRYNTVNIFLIYTLSKLYLTKLHHFVWYFSVSKNTKKIWYNKVSTLHGQISYLKTNNYSVNIDYWSPLPCKMGHDCSLRLLLYFYYESIIHLFNNNRIHFRLAEYCRLWLQGGFLTLKNSSYCRKKQAEQFLWIFFILTSFETVIAFIFPSYGEYLSLKQYSFP